MNQEIKKQLNQAETILSNIHENVAIEYATWTKDKATIKFQKQMPNFAITNNYIYWCDLGIKKCQQIKNT